MDMRAFGDALGKNAAAHGMQVTTCAEADGRRRDNLGPSSSAGKCIDEQLLARLGVAVSEKKDAGQREACGCIASREIGMYDSCRHGCAYCYATVSTEIRAAQRSEGARSALGQPSRSYFRRRVPTAGADEPAIGG